MESGLDFVTINYTGRVGCFMVGTAYRIQTTVQNISDENTAVAIATDWLRDDLDSLDIAQVDASVGTGETEVRFIVRLSEEQVATVQSLDTVMFLGEA